MTDKVPNEDIWNKNLMIPNLARLLISPSKNIEVGNVKAAIYGKNELCYSTSIDNAGALFDIKIDIKVSSYRKYKSTGIGSDKVNGNNIRYINILKKDQRY